MLKRTAILVLVSIGNQYLTLGLQITQTNGSGTCLGAIKDLLFLGHWLFGMLWIWVKPDGSRANRGLTMRFQQHFFMVDHVFGMIRSQLVVLFQGNRTRWTGRLTVTTKDTAQHIYIKDFRIALTSRNALF